MKEEIRNWEIKLFECPVCKMGNKIKATSEKSEKECVTFLIGFLKNHFRKCESRTDKQTLVEFKLKVSKKVYISTLTTYESVYLDRKLIV